MAEVITHDGKMHLHGHVFQVTEVNDRKIAGASRDTIVVLPYSTIKIELDADNPDVWMHHCHHLYHAAAGMITTLNYVSFVAPYFSLAQKTLDQVVIYFRHPEQCLEQ